MALTLTGEFRSVKPARSWTGKDGVTRSPWIVRILDGDTVHQVEFRDEDSAMAAVAGLDEGDEVTLAVYPRAKGKDWMTFEAKRVA